MEPDSTEWLQTPEVVFEAFVGIHKDDKVTCELLGAVPRRVYARAEEDFIELAMNLPQAAERAMQLFGSSCGLTRQSVLVLRVQFTAQGFSKYAAATRGSEWNFCPTLYKRYCWKNHDHMDDGVWAFHADLPLDERADNGQVLVLSEWFALV